MKSLNFCWKKTDLSRLRILVLQSLFSYILCEINVKIGKLFPNKTLLHPRFLQGFQGALQCMSSPQSWFSQYMIHSKVYNNNNNKKLTDYPFA